MKKERLFNLRLFGVVFASLVLGIAFSVNMVAGIIFFFILLISTLLLFLKPRKVCYIIVILLTYLTGFLYASGLNWADDARQDYIDEGYIVGNITIETPHDVDGTVTGIIVLDNIVYNSENIEGKATLVVKDKSITSTLKIGDTLGLRGTLVKETIDTSALGMVRPYIKGIRYAIGVTSVDEHSSGSLSFRDRVVVKIERILFERLDPDTAGFLSGMMFGDTTLITEGVKSASRRLGIAHLFAVSGLHVGMIVGFAMLILSKTKLNKKWYLLILPVLYFYAYMCNFSVSVTRACIMVTILLISKAIYMRYDMLSSLSLAGIIILLINPYYLFDVSFVMSFLAVLSIALFSDRIFKFLTRKSLKWKNAKMILSANLSVNIGLLPIMLHLFGGVSFLTLPVNFVLIPIITAIFPALFLLILLSIMVHLYVLIPVFAAPFVLIVYLSKLIAQLNFVGINFEVSWYFVCTYVVVMILASKYVFISKKVKLVPKVSLCAILILSLVVPSINTGINGNRVEGVDAYDSYAVTYIDDSGERVLVLMGDIDRYLLSKSTAMLSRNNTGSVDILVLPYARQSDMDMIDDYNRTLGASEIMTREEMVFVTADNITAHEGIDIIGKGDILIDTDNVNMLLVSPSNNMSYSGNYDMVVAHNNDMKTYNFTSKYYKNFAQSSHGERCLGFTFCAKNGKISLYNEIY